VLSDFEKARGDGIERYRAELAEKIEILVFLIDNYNDGRRKSFYCNAVNMLRLDDVREIVCEIRKNVSDPGMDIKRKTEYVVLLFEAKAKKKNIELKLRK